MTSAVARDQGLPLWAIDEIDKGKPVSQVMSATYEHMLRKE